MKDITDQYITLLSGTVVITEPPKPASMLRLETIDEIRKRLKNS